MLITQTKTVAVLNRMTGELQRVKLYSLDGQTWASKPRHLARWQWLKKLYVADIQQQFTKIDTSTVRHIDY